MSQRSNLHEMRVRGQLLIHVKATVRYGLWGDWLRAHCEVNEDTAERWMLIAREWERVMTTQPGVATVREFLAEVKRLKGPDGLPRRGKGGTPDAPG